MIIGGPGSGKTTLGGQLSHQLDLPVFSVDDAVWDSNGNLRSVKTIDALVRAKIAEERWIIEGGNTRTYNERALRSDLVIWLNPPLWLRFIRVLRRDGPKFRLLLWTLKYDRTFGIKDRAILSFAEHTTNCFEVRTEDDAKDILRELGVGPDIGTATAKGS